MSTQYIMLVTEDDHRKAREILRMWKHRDPDREFGAPLLVAVRDDVWIGIAGTAPNPHAVVCNLLALNPEIRPTARSLMGIHLMEHYEELLRRLGCLWYNITLDKDDDKSLDYMGRFGAKPYHTDNQCAWFRRELV